MPSTPHPAEGDLLAYGRSIGVDLGRYTVLRSFVTRGFNEPLPDPWVATRSEDVLDATGDDGVLYFNTETGVCIEEHPNDKIFRMRALDAMRRIDRGENAAAVAASLLMPRELPAHVAHVNKDLGDEDGAATAGPSGIDHDLVDEVFGVDAGPPEARAGSRPAFDVPVPESDDSDSGDVTPCRRACEAAPTGPEGAAAEDVEVVVQPTKQAAPLPPPRPGTAARPAAAELVSIPDDVEPVDHDADGHSHPPPHSARKPRVAMPAEFICPITAELMHDPVVAMDGFSYERQAIAQWLQTHDTSPCTNAVMPARTLIPNTTLRNFIRDFMDRHHVDFSD
jgi:hypothetical protein